MSGVGAVIAKSLPVYSSVNAINIGLPLLVADTDEIDEGDELEVNFKDGLIKDITKGQTITTSPIPDFMLGILNEGGLLPYLRKFGDFKLEETK